MKSTFGPRVIVTDLGFGDAGKGTVTDFLVRQLGARAVVRFNGGAQAGHTVVTKDGRHHTFSQFGAGTLVPGVRTFLSKHVVVHPTALLVEADHLARIGEGDALRRITVSEECLVTTPFQQAATCVRELARGASRHGSCGVGVGETMRDALASPGSALRAGDLSDAPRLSRLLRERQEEKRSELTAELQALPASDLAAMLRRTLEDADVVRAWVDRTRAVVSAGIVEDDTRLGALLRSDEPVVFEGAQGVLLDEWRGFHPFTTWSTCTFDNAEALLREHTASASAFRLGLLRSFATRHGAGPFPTESTEIPEGRTTEHNESGLWQGHFRSGWLDAVLLRYAIAACRGVDGLAVTHLDRFVPGSPCKIAVGYDTTSGDEALFDRQPELDVSIELRLGVLGDLTHTARLATALERVAPRYREILGGPGDIVEAIESASGVPVVLTSTGPMADEKRLRGS